jgi:cobalt-zinc-cadmium efflux system protein
LHKNGLDSHEHEHGDECCAHHEDLNIKSAYLHMLGDAIISAGVVAGSLAAYYLGTYIIDQLLSVVFCVYVFSQSFAVLRRTFFTLMDKNDGDMERIIGEILAIDGIDGVHDIHLYSPSSRQKFFSAHLVFNENKSLEEIENTLEQIRRSLEHRGITHTVLQPETMKYAQLHHLCTAHQGKQTDKI